MPAKVILRIVAGPLKGQRFEFHEHDTLLCGRHSSCHVMLPKDKFVSRHHFLLEVNPPYARIRDLASGNGTVVNGVRYGGRRKVKASQSGDGEPPSSETDLHDGDRIVVGNTQIQVRIRLPLKCQRCGVEIVHVPRPPSQKVADVRFCADCRQPPVQNGGQRAVVEGRRCDYCGKEVGDEVHPNQPGSYVCRSCQATLLNQSGGLRQLMQEAARQRNSGAPVEIPGHEIRGEIGKGGMGAVYLGVRQSDQRRVAIKIMLAKIAVAETARQVFLREVKISEKLQHPNIVGFLDSGSAGSAFYLVMEYCSAGSLDKLLARHGGRLTWRKAKTIMLQCLEGLAYAHRMGFVHRDLKPHNIILHLHEGSPIAKISDFGLAKSFASAGLSGMTATGSFGGTFSYMPREQLVDFKYARPASDVWSLGATFYRVLTGRHPRECPVDRDPVEVVLQEAAVPIRQRDPVIPAPVAIVIDRALATRPEDRFQTAGEMKIALAKAMKSAP